MPTPTNRKKPGPDFVIRMVGAIRPWNVPLRQLTRVLNAVQRLIEHTEEEPIEHEGGAEQEAAQVTPLHLIEITSGSADYGVCAIDSQAAVDTLTETGRCLTNPENTECDPTIFGPIEDISAVAKSLNVEIEFERPGKDGEVLAKITPQSYQDLSRGAFVTGESTLYGHLERVGGAVEKHCGLRLATQPSKMLICHVATEDLVRKLGQHVYEDVRVSGTVTWFRKNLRVKTIQIDGFDEPKEGSILDALDRVYKAGGKAWDDVADPQALIAEIRGT